MNPAKSVHDQNKRTRLIHSNYSQPINYLFITRKISIMISSRVAKIEDILDLARGVIADVILTTNR